MINKIIEFNGYEWKQLSSNKLKNVSHRKVLRRIKNKICVFAKIGNHIYNISKDKWTKHPKNKEIKQLFPKTDGYDVF